MGITFWYTTPWMRGTVHWNFREKLLLLRPTSKLTPTAAAAAPRLTLLPPSFFDTENFESSLDCKTPSNEYGRVDIVVGF